MTKHITSETEFWKKHSTLRVVFEIVWKRIEILVTTLIVSGTIGGCNYHQHVKTEQWVGQHLEQKQKQINELKQSSNN